MARTTKAWPGWIRAFAVVLCLTGSLLPSPGGIDVAVVGGAAALLILGRDVLGSRRLPDGTGLVFVLFFALFLPWLIADPTEVVTPYGAEKFTRLFTLTLLSAAVALTVVTRRGLMTVAWAWVLVALVLAAGTITGVTDAAGRAVGLVEANPIWLARAIASGAICAAWLAATRKVPVLLGVAVVGVLLAGIFATGSRGPASGVVVGLLVIMLSIGRTKGAVLAAALAWVGFTVVSTSAWFQQSRFGETVEAGTEDTNAQSRLTMWRDTVTVIEDSPLGVGYGNWQSVTPGFHYSPYPHNLFLEVLAEAGWVTGLVVLGAVAMVVIRLGRRAMADRSATLALALLASETIAVSFSGDVNARTWWFLLVLGWAVSKWPQEQSAEETEAEAATDVVQVSTR